MKQLSKTSSLVCLLICLALLSLFLSSCFYWGYGGEHEELFTVAVNNIFHSFGSTSNGEVSYDPEVQIVETDDYGRVLFFYNECYGKGDWFGMAFVIMQKVEGQYVYYYQDACYTPFFDTSDYFYYPNRNTETYLRAVELATDLDALKERNDWNQDLNLDKCTKAKISNEKPKKSIPLEKDYLNEVLYQYAKEIGYTGSDKDGMCGPSDPLYCNSDTEGNDLYAFYCTACDKDSEGNNVWTYFRFVVIVSRDKEQNPIIREGAIAEITDITEYYNVVTELKEKNGWTYPS